MNRKIKIKKKERFGVMVPLSNNVSEAKILPGPLGDEIDRNSRNLIDRVEPAVFTNTNLGPDCSFCEPLFYYDQYTNGNVDEKILFSLFYLNFFFL